jgi:very-short-patch-repair endonuclease
MPQPKGCIPWNKGKTGVQLIWNKGIPRTPEEKEAISKGISKEARKRKSEIMKNRWKDGKYKIMLGVTNPSCLKEVGEKIGLGNKKRIWSEKSRKKAAESKRGRPRCPMSEENKQAASIRMKENNPMFRDDVKAKHPALQKGFIFRSSGEKTVWKSLEDMGMVFKEDFDSQYPVKRPKKRSYFLDFYLMKFNLVIEFDGHSHHYLSPEKDLERDIYILNKLGAKTLRLLPKDLNDKNLLKFKIGRFIQYESKI